MRISKRSIAILFVYIIAAIIWGIYPPQPPHAGFSGKHHVAYHSVEKP